MKNSLVLIVTIFNLILPVFQGEVMSVAANEEIILKMFFGNESSTSRVAVSK